MPLVCVDAKASLKMRLSEPHLNFPVSGAGMGQGPQGQTDGSPVGWVSTNPPALTVPPFSSSSLELQYSSAPSPILSRKVMQGLYFSASYACCGAACCLLNDMRKVLHVLPENLGVV